MDVTSFIVFIGGIIGLVGAIGWAVTTVIKARRGRFDDDAQMIAHSRANELLAQENQEMRGKMARLEDRLSVLERIATDPAQRLEREIAQLG